MAEIKGHARYIAGTLSGILGMASGVLVRWHCDCGAEGPPQERLSAAKRGARLHESKSHGRSDGRGMTHLRSFCEIDRG